LDRSDSQRLRDLAEMRLYSGAFALSLSGEEDGGSESQSSSWTLWGAGDLQSLSGAEQGARVDGELRSLYLGVDVERTNGWLLGLAVSQGWGETGWMAENGLSGEFDTRTTFVYPYARGVFGNGWEAWALAGIGRGDVESRRLSSDEIRETDAVETAVDGGDLEGALALAGARRALNRDGAIRWSLLADAATSKLEVADGESALTRLDAVSVHRMRLGIEAEAGGGPLTASLRLFGRADGGDSLKGSGAELSGGLGYSRGRLEASLNGRWLFTHSSDGYEEASVSALIRFHSREDGTGLSLSLAPAWERAGMGAGSLGTGFAGGFAGASAANVYGGGGLGASGPSGLAGAGGMSPLGVGNAATSGLRGEVAYGVKSARLDALLRPFLSYEERGGGAQVLTGLSIERPLQVRLSAGRSTGAGTLAGVGGDAGWAFEGDAAYVFESRAGAWQASPHLAFRQTSGSREWRLGLDFDGRARIGIALTRYADRPAAAATGIGSVWSVGSTAQSSAFGDGFHSISDGFGRHTPAADFTEGGFGIELRFKWPLGLRASPREATAATRAPDAPSIR